MAIVSLSDENAAVYHSVLADIERREWRFGEPSKTVLDWRYAIELYGPAAAKNILSVVNDLMLAAREDERKRVFASLTEIRASQAKERS